MVVQACNFRTSCLFQLARAYAASTNEPSRKKLKLDDPEPVKEYEIFRQFFNDFLIDPN